MIQKEFEITNKLGLHSRASYLLAETACIFESTSIAIFRKKTKVNAKSVMGVMMLAASSGKIIIHADGDEEETAINFLGQLFESNFYEEDYRNLPEIFYAVNDKNIVLIKKLLEKCHRYTRIIGPQFLTPFEYAIRNGDIEIVDLLLSYGADINRNRGATRFAETPLSDAISLGLTQVAFHLAKKGANFDNHKEILLQWALKEENTEILEYITRNSIDVDELQ
jgi:phosphocarrier protein